MRLGRFLATSLLAAIFSAGFAAAQNNDFILHRFQLSDGAGPQGSLIADAQGNLYGTAQVGGDGDCTYPILKSGCGLVFELSPEGGGGWKEIVLYQFQGGSDGAFPVAGLVSDQAGNLYGTTYAGGNGGCDVGPDSGCGTVYVLSPPSQRGGSWTESVLYRFTNLNDGSEPRGALVFDHASNLYGTTHGWSGSGSAFKLSPSGNLWIETTLHTFNPIEGNDGDGPDAALVFDQMGNAYGTTAAGGLGSRCTFGCGSVFQLMPPASPGGIWTERIVYSFQGGADGEYPGGDLLLIDGSLVGTTTSGGEYGLGTVFQVTQTTHGITEKILYSFRGGSDGSFPVAGLAVDSKFQLYGTTEVGGDGNCPTGPGCGTVFRLSPPTSPGGTWTEKLLYAFEGGQDGFGPNGTPLMGNGWLVGVTGVGGGSQACSSQVIGCGTVFAVHQ